MHQRSLYIEMVRWRTSATVEANSIKKAWRAHYLDASKHVSVKNYFDGVGPRCASFLVNGHTCKHTCTHTYIYTKHLLFNGMRK